MSFYILQGGSELPEPWVVPGGQPAFSATCSQVQWPPLFARLAHWSSLPSERAPASLRGGATLVPGEPLAIQEQGDWLELGLLCRAFSSA